MKSLLLLTALTLPVLGQPTISPWVNFIRQNQLSTGLLWDMPVGVSGTAPSPLAINESGALFQLWAIQPNTASDFLLDQKLVGAYLPSATVKIETKDSYPHVKRTRADQPFTVTVVVEGLLSAPDLPLAATQVLLEHHLAPSSSPDNFIDPRQATSGEPVASGYLGYNGTHTFEFTSSQLPAADPTQAFGEEYFVVHALADAPFPQTQIAWDSIQVFPVASGGITGISQGQLVRFDNPIIEIALQDLYPASTTYLEIRSNSAGGTTAQRIDGSTLVLDQDRAEDRVIRIFDWLDGITESGTYTLDLITTTPFGTEKLDSINFVFDRTISVNAQITDHDSDSAPVSP